MNHTRVALWTKGLLHCSSRPVTLDSTTGLETSGGQRQLDHHQGTPFEACNCLGLLSLRWILSRMARGVMRRRRDGCQGNLDYTEEWVILSDSLTMDKFPDLYAIVHSSRPAAGNCLFDKPLQHKELRVTFVRFLSLLDRDKRHKTAEAPPPPPPRGQTPHSCSATCVALKNHLPSF